MIFSIFRFFYTLRFQIYKYCPNHTSMEILFILFSDDAYISIKKIDPYDWFCAPGSHINNSNTLNYIVQLTDECSCIYDVVERLTSEVHGLFSTVRM